MSGLGRKCVLISTAVLLVSMTNSVAQESDADNYLKWQLLATPATGKVLSSYFWDNSKPGDFERLFVPGGETPNQMTSAQRKKAMFRMFKKAIAARASSAGQPGYVEHETPKQNITAPRPYVRNVYGAIRRPQV